MARWKMILPLMIIPCIMFCGCASRADVEVNKAGITEYYKALTACSMQVGISADFPERVSEYKVKYTYAKDADSIIELIKPESVSGIKIRISKGLSQLEFDGARLETGKINEGGTTPMSALPFMMKQWLSGDVSQFEKTRYNDADAVLMVYCDESCGETVEYRTWFDVSSYYPLYAEVFVDRKCFVRCEFETVTVS